jgi:hypothetical protein
MDRQRKTLEEINRQRRRAAVAQQRLDRAEDTLEGHESLSASEISDAHEARRERPASPAPAAVVPSMSARLRRRLRQRDALREAFLLTEILGPPRAMRD